MGYELQVRTQLPEPTADNAMLRTDGYARCEANEHFLVRINTTRHPLSWTPSGGYTDPSFLALAHQVFRDLVCA